MRQTADFRQGRVLSGQELDDHVDNLAIYYETLEPKEAKVLNREQHRLLPCKDLAHLLRLAQGGVFASSEKEAA